MEAGISPQVRVFPLSGDITDTPKQVTGTPNSKIDYFLT
jgi:hypothetical protein